MQEKSILVIDSPKNCKECQLHIMTNEASTETDFELHDRTVVIEVFSCAGYKGRGTLNPEYEFLNIFGCYSKGIAPNCPLVKE